MNKHWILIGTHSNLIAVKNMAVHLMKVKGIKIILYFIKKFKLLYNFYILLENKHLTKQSKE